MKKVIWVLLLIAISLGCSKGKEEAKPGAATVAPPSQTAAASAPAAAVPPPPPVAAGPIFMTTPPAQTSELIQKRKDLLLIDVRSPQELREGSIEGSTLLPFWNIMKGEFDLPKDRPILLICAVGGRSYAAGQILAQKGYKEIYNLQGGIDAWKRAGLPLKY